MTLNGCHRKFISDKLKSVWKGKRPCPCCIGDTVWGISDIVEVKQFNEGNSCPGAAIIPLVLITCNTCGYSIMFNGIALGVVDPITGKVKEGNL